MLRMGFMQNPMGHGIRFESFRGTTGVDGRLTFTFPKPFNEIRHVNVERLPPTNPAVFQRVESLSLSAMTIIVEQRASLSVLGIDLLSFAVTPVVGQEVTMAAVGS